MSIEETIDQAIRDFEISPDAMRWTPEPVPNEPGPGARSYMLPGCGCPLCSERVQMEQRYLRETPTVTWSFPTGFLQARQEILERFAMALRIPSELLISRTTPVGSDHGVYGTRINSRDAETGDYRDYSP